jgi:oxepin-CoA hydrolase/3-oxo-5,6-dehydrosuberyl-CoA semialdehyde dehydrogenase
MDEQKKLFLESEGFSLLKNLATDTPAKWGKMNAQQMLEHLEDFFSVSIEEKIFPLVTPEEQLPLYQKFLYSDKQFRENTKAPLDIIGEEPLPVRGADLLTAQQNLQQTTANFFKYFIDNPGKQTVHPVFGSLTFEEWVLLHYKHVTHHYRQFSLLS